MWRNHRRVILAFAVCPVLPALLIVLAFKTGLYEVPDGGDSLYANFLLIASIVSIPASWVFGIPLYVWFRKQKITSLTAFIVGGGGISVILSLPFIPIVLAALPLGIIISALIWLAIFGFRRAQPDQP